MIFAKNLNMKLVSLLVCCNPCLLDKPWLDVRKGFVEGLPKSHLKFVVFVVVDRLTKYTHFMALSHPYTATMVANLYLHFVFKLHGMPSTIVSDRDPVFTSFFGRN